MISGFNVETCPLYLIQCASPLKNIDCAVFSDSTLRASFWLEKVLEMESCSHGIQSLKAFNMNLGYCVQHTGLLKTHYFLQKVIQNLKFSGVKNIVMYISNFHHEIVMCL